MSVLCYLLLEPLPIAPHNANLCIVASLSHVSERAAVQSSSLEEEYVIKHAEEDYNTDESTLRYKPSYYTYK
jgi:hypothetical protein